MRQSQDRRRGEPPLLNGPVTSRMISTAVFHTGVFINNELRKTPDAACRILCNRRIVRQSADRCLKQHPGDLRPHGRDPTGRLQPRNSSNRKSPLSRLATRKQGKPKQYDRGKNSPLEKSAKFYRRTGTYCLTSKDIQMFALVMKVQVFKFVAAHATAADNRLRNRKG